VALGVAAGYALGTNRDSGQIGTEDGVLVVVTTVEIPSGTSLDPLVAHEKFETILVSTSMVVPDAVTDVRQLQGMTTMAPIYENEQIPLAPISDAP